MRALIILFCSLSLALHGKGQMEDWDTGAPVKSITVVQRAPASTTKVLANVAVADQPRYMGFNTSYLLQQLLPFNAIPVQQNMYGVTYRKYTQGKGYRISMGANLSNLEELQWLGFRIDRDRRKAINNRWLYFYGIGGGLEIFQDPDNIDIFVQTEVNLLGQMHFGVEYIINPVMSLSMESQGSLRLGSSSSLVVRPPTVITAHFRLN